eukprot:gene1272-1857_t
MSTSRIEDLKSELAQKLKQLPPVIKTCESVVLSETIYPLFANDLESRPDDPMGECYGLETRWTALSSALRSEASGSQYSEQDAAAVRQLEEALDSAQEDAYPDLRGLLPIKVAATTPTPPPYLVTCRQCSRVVLAARFRGLAVVEHLPGEVVQMPEREAESSSVMPRGKRTAPPPPPSGGVGGASFKRKRTALTVQPVTTSGLLANMYFTSSAAASAAAAATAAAAANTGHAPKVPSGTTGGSGGAGAVAGGTSMAGLKKTTKGS